MKHLKGNLHTHSTLSDGRLSPEDMIKEYKKKDYDFVAMTDHRYQKEKAYEYPDIKGITVLEGAEMSSQHHYNYIEGDNKILTILNHPFRYNDSINEIDRRDTDLVEITEHGDLYYNCDPDSGKIVERAKKLGVMTDDAHSKRMVGHAWIIVRSPSKKKDDIIKNIKKGNYSIEKGEL